MQQKKQKREARKLKAIPYNRVVGTATAAQLGPNSDGVGVPSNHMIEEVEAA